MMSEFSDRCQEQDTRGIGRAHLRGESDLKAHGGYLCRLEALDARVLRVAREALSVEGEGGGGAGRGSAGRPPRGCAGRGRGGARGAGWAATVCATTRWTSPAWASPWTTPPSRSSGPAGRSK